MRVFIYVAEDNYGGRNGLFDQRLVVYDDNEDIKHILSEVDCYGEEMAYELFDSFSCLEDDEIEDAYWVAYKVRDDVKLSLTDLDEIAYNEGADSFIEEYCEKRELHEYEE